MSITALDIGVVGHLRVKQGVGSVMIRDLAVQAAVPPRSKL